MPTEIPKFSIGQLERLLEHKNNYIEVALRILEKWLPEIPPSILKKMLINAYEFPKRFDDPNIAPLTNLGNNQFLLELYHGPTASFKDFALQFFPQLFAYIAKELYPENNYAILVSTSGDTGSATVDGFCSQTPFPVVVLFPENGVSPVQKAQMIHSKEPNLLVIGVEKDFDFCQSALKQLFNNEVFTKVLKGQYNLFISAANSINWGRLVPQIVYHIFGYLQLVLQNQIVLGDEIDISVPTGNYGNILAATLAKLSGVPFAKLLCASNENSVLTDFIQKGIYDIRHRELIKTSSPSIDILKSSNLERLLFLLTQDPNFVKRSFLQLDQEKYFQIDNSLLGKVQEIFDANWCSESKSFNIIKETFNQSQILLDPHTAVAKYVADQYHQISSTKRKLVICSTAHPSKFPLAILQALHSTLPTTLSTSLSLSEQIQQLKEVKSRTQMHQRIEETCKGKPTQRTICQASLSAIQTQIESFFQNFYSSKS